MAQQLGRASLPGSATPGSWWAAPPRFVMARCRCCLPRKGRQDVPLALGQSVKLRVAYGAPVSGVALPAASVQRNSANQPWCGCTTAPSCFAPGRCKLPAEWPGCAGARPARRPPGGERRRRAAEPDSLKDAPNVELDGGA